MSILRWIGNITLFTIRIPLAAVGTVVTFPFITLITGIEYIFDGELFVAEDAWKWYGDVWARVFRPLPAPTEPAKPTKKKAEYNKEAIAKLCDKAGHDFWFNGEWTERYEYDRRGSVTSTIKRAEAVCRICGACRLFGVPKTKVKRDKFYEAVAKRGAWEA